MFFCYEKKLIYYLVIVLLAAAIQVLATISTGVVSSVMSEFIFECRARPEATNRYPPIILVIESNQPQNGSLKLENTIPGLTIVVGSPPLLNSRLTKFSAKFLVKV